MSRLIVSIVGAVVVTAALLVPVLLIVRAERGQAAFGDVETLGVNRLGAATLNVEIGPQTVPLVVSNMAPGDRAVGSIDVVNSGSLVFRYSLTLEPTNPALDRWLSWDLWVASSCESDFAPIKVPVDRRRQSDGSVLLLGDPLPGDDPGDRELGPGRSELVCVAAMLDLGAPDSTQGLSSGHDVVVTAEHALSQEADSSGRGTP